MNKMNQENGDVLAEPKISFIVPVYNVAPYLKDCLDSLLNQNFDSFEIIIVYDTSEDESLDICTSYANNDSRVCVFTREVNEGRLCGARNFGIRQARGEYICIIDSDDIVSKDLLRITYDMITRHDVEVVFFDAELFQGNMKGDWDATFDYSQEKRDLSLRVLRHEDILRGYMQWILSGNAFQRLCKKNVYYDYDAFYYMNQASESTFQAVPMVQRIKSAFYIPLALYKIRYDRPGSIRYGLKYSNKVLHEFIGAYLYRLKALEAYGEEIFTLEEKYRVGLNVLKVMVERYLQYQKDALHSLILTEQFEMEAICLFGAATVGMEHANILKNTRVKVCFCDNDSKKKNQIVNGIKLISYEELKRQYREKDVRLFITSNYYVDIALQLLADGIIDSVSELMPLRGATEREKAFGEMFEQFFFLDFVKRRNALI